MWRQPQRYDVEHFEALERGEALSLGPKREPRPVGNNLGSGSRVSGDVVQRYGHLIQPASK